MQAGINGLMRAAEGGHLHIVEFFVGQGVDVNQVTKVIRSTSSLSEAVTPRSNITDYFTVENRSSLGCSVKANVYCKGNVRELLRGLDSRARLLALVDSRRQQEPIGAAVKCLG